MILRIHNIASKVNELSDVEDVDGTERKQERVLEVMALASIYSVTME